MTFDEALALYDSGREWLEVPIEEREALLQRLEVGQLPGGQEERDRQTILRRGRTALAEVEHRRTDLLKATEGLPRQPYQPSFVGEVLKPAGQTALDLLTSPRESLSKAREYFTPQAPIVQTPTIERTDRPVSQPAVEAPPVARAAPTGGDVSLPGIVAPEAPLPVQGPPARPGPLERTLVEPFTEAGKSFLFRGPVKLFDWLDEQAERLSKATGWSKGGLFRDLANLARQQAGGEPVDPTFATRVLGKIAEFPTGEMPKLLAFTSALGTIPGFAALGALEGSKEGTKEALIGAVTNALFGAELKAVQPFGLGVRAGGGAATFAGQAVAGGERDPEKLLEEAASGAIFMAPGAVRGQQVRRMLREGYQAPTAEPVNLFTRLGVDPDTVTLPELREAVTIQAQQIEAKIGRAKSDKQRQAGIQAYQELVQNFREAQQVLGREIPARTPVDVPPIRALPPGTEPKQIPGIVAPGAMERAQIQGPPVAGEVRGGRVYGGGPIEARPERFDVLRPGQGRLPQVPELPIARRIPEEAARVVAPLPEELEIQQRPPFLIQKPREAPVPVPKTPVIEHAERTPISVDDIHQLADAKGIPWDKDETFMALTEQVTGKRHLDKLTPAERQEFYTVLERLSFKPTSKPTPPAPKEKAKTNILSDEEFEQYKQRVRNFVNRSDIPDYAKQAIISEERMLQTNKRIDAHLTDAQWEKATLQLEELRKRNPDLREGKFTARGSVSKGPIVLDHSGNIIDGNNRVYEAIKRGDKEITVLRPMIQKSREVSLTPETIHREYPSIGETRTIVKERTEAGLMPSKLPEIPDEVPRHALPPEENAELYARALKAKADLEIAGSERGTKVFMEQQGQGSTQEVIGLKSPTARWYKEATTGAGKLSRERVERAVQKILQDQGRDKGKDVERIKELLFQDREFMKTPFAPKTDAEWQSLIQEAVQPYQPETAGLSMILPRDVPDVGAPTRRTTPPAIQVPEPRQQTIPLPPPTIGERPKIGREVTPEEAPLFSKAAQEPEPEQQRLTELAAPSTKPRQAPVRRLSAEKMRAVSEATGPVILGDVRSFITDLATRKHFTDVLDVQVNVDPEMKETAKTVIRKLTPAQEAAGVPKVMIKLSRLADDEVFFHELAHAQRAMRGREFSAATEAKLEASAKKAGEFFSGRESELAEVFREEATDAAKKVRPRQPRIPVAPIADGPAKPLTDIVLDLEKGLGHKLTIGKPGPRRAGVYQPGSTATIIRYSGDLDTTAHELAHALDDRFGLVKDWKGEQVSPFDAELEPFAQHGSVTSSGPQATPTYRRAEGVAEWMRAWLVNPQAAEAAAPRFAAHVKQKLPKAIQESLGQFSTQVRQWAGNSAHAKIMANVQWETPESGLLHWLTGERTAKGPGFQLTVFDQMATQLTDRLAPFMKAIEYARDERGLTKTPLPGNDPAVLARLYMGIHAKMDDIFAKGMIDAKLERATAGGLNWMLEPLDRSFNQALERDMQEVASLMIAQRTVERIAKDTTRQVEAIKELKLPPEQERTRIERVRAAARERHISGAGAGIEQDIAVAEGRLRELGKDPARLARLNEAADRYRQWADANLRYLVEKGRLSQQQYEVIKSNNEYYVAMQRLLEVSPGEELVVSLPRGVSGRKLGQVGQPIKTFKGSMRPIKNPYLSLMDATYQVVREADRNEVMGLFRDLLTTPRGMYEGEPAELASVGRLAKSGEKHTIPIYKNGKQEIWQFHPEVYKALKGIEEGAYKLPWVVTILPRVLRASIVNAPPFALRNVIRDAWHRTIMSQVSSKPWDSLKPYTAEEIAKLKRSGGDQAGHYYSDAQNYARALKFAMGEAIKDQRNIVADPAKLWHWAKKGGEGYLDLMQQSERQGRLAEYRRALDHAKTKLNYDDYHAMLYAASQARGLLDYAVAGNWLQLLNQVVPFSNAAVQGVRVNILRAKADPIRYASRFGIFAVLPALLTYAWNYLFADDLEEYRQLPAYQRDLFWNFKLGPDLWLKIPKPFEIGVLATTFERALDAAMGNEKAFEGHVGAFLRTLLPVDEASFAGPLQGVFQATANYDFFRDRPIVPRWEENLTLDLRNTHRGSRLGQAIQQAIGVDSRKIDFIMQQQFGYVGRWAVDISDIGRKEKTGFTLSASGVLGPSPAGASLDVRWVMDQAEARGVAASSGKVVERLKSVKDVRAGMSGVKNPDAVRYGVFRKIQDAYHEAKSDADRDRLAAQLRTEAKLLRGLWEREVPNPKAEERTTIKRQRETGELTKAEAEKKLKALQRRRAGQPAAATSED